MSGLPGLNPTMMPQPTPSSVPASGPAELLDMGGRGPSLHLAHGNGFPPGTYRLLAEALAEQAHVVALPARPLWPGTRPESTLTWRPMAGDLLRALDRGQDRRYVGVGHSLGGVLTLWAASDRPDLFRGVVLVDPVILPPTWLLFLRFAAALGLGRRTRLVRATRRRRQVWPNRQACFDHLRGKPVFGRWSDAALWDYVQAGTDEQDDGSVRLVYPPAWEAHIFATVPTGIWHDVGRLRVPCLVVRGEQSETFVPAAQARLARRLPQAHQATVPAAGHLVPMERPDETAAIVLDFMSRLPA